MTGSRRVDPRRASAGFTLIELLTVVAILGLGVGWSVVSYTGVTEEQQLHSAVRHFVGTYRELRNLAAKDRRVCIIEFDIRQGRWRQLVYPRKDRMGRFYDLTRQGEVILLEPDEVEERVEAKRWEYLQKDIFFKDIQAPGPDGNEAFVDDYWVMFRADGTIPPHMIHFNTAKKLEMTMEVEEISGRVAVHAGYLDFYSPQEEEFDVEDGGSSLAR
ncbi:MAG: prepilin-type N-terminal cleavage/methylation domain-containing protein [Planctomycetes bacterium]|nr:prepilin-type N-terminal cleavage/methylation domain-containing protein [Planctomycetota bacterium]